MAHIDLSKLQTETRNPRSVNIDEVATLDACEIIHREDRAVADTVTEFVPVISAAVDALAPRVRQGGRAIYVGAGTSGRLGVLDASEIPPTFSAPFEQFVGIMAGGDAAIRRAQEGAEDSAAAGQADLERLNLNPELDSLIGIAASGRTPYVLGCLKHAKKLGCITIAVVCCSPSAIGESGDVDFLIAPVTGPEVVTGSTRMKAGTATKMVLNMISTAVMIRVGKTFGNMMVDVKMSNKKLVQRSRNIIRDLGGKKAPQTDMEIDSLLQQCGNSVKLALATIHLGVSVDEARNKLEVADGVLAKAIAQTPISSALRPMESSKLVLCIDGGATKCAAVILGPHGAIGEGQAGPCNVYVCVSLDDEMIDKSRTGMDMNVAIATIKLASTNALQDLAARTKTMPPSLHSVPFARIWIGLAGYESTHLQPSLQAALSKLFQRPVGPQFQISSDIDLLSSVLGSNNHARHGIALVAGTGSIALHFSLRDGIPRRDRRSGGWGHLLGDDGSGFALGRAAIRMTLAALDAHRGPNAMERSHLGELPRRVIDQLQLRGPVTNGDVLSAVMSPQPASDAPARDHRTRIAGVSRAVIDAAALGDMQARTILDEGVEGLLRTIKPLLPDDWNLSQTSLILGGGLLANELYQGLFLDRSVKEGIRFAAIQTVTHPARSAAEYLRAGVEAEARHAGRVGMSKL